MTIPEKFESLTTGGESFEQLRKFEISDADRKSLEQNTCPNCGSGETFEYEGKDAPWRCETCGTWFKCETHYRVKEE